MWLKWIYGNVGIIGDWVGQLGESGEYWMGRKGSCSIWNFKLQGGRPRQCQIRPTSVGSKWISFELCTGTYGIFWCPTNLLASSATELDDTLPYLMGVTRESAWATHDVSTEAYACKTCTSVLWARLDSWTVATRGAFMAHVCCVVRLFPLQGRLLIQISVTPLEMGDACSPNLNVELSTSYYYDDNYMDKNDYMVVMTYVNRNCLDTLACLV
jgi:hypothetical protein